MFLYLDYVQELIMEVFTLAEECRMTFDDVPMMIPAPPPLCSSFDTELIGIQSELNRMSLELESGDLPRPKAIRSETNSKYLMENNKTSARL